MLSFAVGARGNPCVSALVVRAVSSVLGWWWWGGGLVLVVVGWGLGLVVVVAGYCTVPMWRSGGGVRGPPSSGWCFEGA
jgi:uncharacterized membrane protein